MFGGDTLTATDLAVAAGLADIGSAERVGGLDADLVRAGLERIALDVATIVDRMRTSATPLPVVAVGGGSILVPDELEGASEVRRPEHFAVANAIGAAIAQVGGEVDRIFAVDGTSRESVLDEAKQEAVDKAVERRRAAGHGRDLRRRGGPDRLPARQRHAHPRQGGRGPAAGGARPCVRSGSASCAISRAARPCSAPAVAATPTSAGCWPSRRSPSTAPCGWSTSPRCPTTPSSSPAR